SRPPPPRPSRCIPRRLGTRRRDAAGGAPLQWRDHAYDRQRRATGVARPRPMNLIAQTLADGLVLGGIYALAAVGFSLIFGVLHVINLSHGILVLLGAY